VGKDVTNRGGLEKEKKVFYVLLFIVLKYLIFAVAKNSDKLFLCNFWALKGFSVHLLQSISVLELINIK
jgi:hypothetical protein